MQGSIQQVFFLMKSMDNKEVNILALKYLLDLKPQLPDDPELPEMEHYLLYSLVKNYFLKPEVFFHSYQEGRDTVQVDSMKMAQDLSLSKYQKIHHKMDKEQGASHANYYKYAFVRIFGRDSSFSKSWNAMVVHLDSMEQLDNLKELVRKGRQQDLNARKGFALGIDTLVIVNPEYLVLKPSEGNYYEYQQEIDYQASEAGKLKMSEVMNQMARKLRVKFTVLDNKSLDSAKVSMFNDINVLNDWLEEKSSFSDTSYVASNNDQFRQVADKYKSRYFCWTTIRVSKFKHEISPLTICASVVLLPALPFVLYARFHPSYYTTINTRIIDSKTGNVIMDDESSVRMRDTKALLRSQIYYMMQQIKNKRTVKVA